MTTPMPAESDAPKGMSYIQFGWEKCKKQPMVPIGVAATTFALLGATASLRSGNRKQFQHFLRLRVAAQGLTVVAMVIGAYMISNKNEEAKEARHRALTGQLPHDADSQPATITALKERRPEDTDQAYDHLYPTRAKTKVSDFTRRLRAAEDQEAADEAARNNTEAMAAAREDAVAVAAAAAKAMAKEGK